jgi:gliding motility-associated lipoprotein GldH
LIHFLASKKSGQVKLFYFCKNYFVKVYSDKLSILLLTAVIFCLTACSTIDVFEKNTPIPGHEWNYALQPKYDFTVSDTASFYNVYVILRHTDAYRYNNIWINFGSKFAGDTLQFRRLDLALGTDANGWEGSGVGDIWELRKSVTQGPIKFNKVGTYTFTLAQIMRENPLPEIISVGIRVEKVK